jgi:ATP-dependent helicase HrpB
MSLASLPIDAVLPEVIAGLRRHANLVLRAATGAGKTARVPPALLNAGLARDGMILVLQPRRVAARATATRMAQERGTELGGEVGFQTRFERRMSRHTRIACITEGILLRRLLDDPFLEGVSTIVFDEFHERNLASDLSLGMVRQVQQTVRPELSVVVMSATLDPLPISAYLGNCPAVESEGRTFPVAIEYSRDIDRRPLDVLAAGGVHELLARTSGDVLVFLPGVGEIRSAARQLAGLSSEGIRVHQLYGDLPADQQDAVLQPGRERKVILSTNVAETSLTIEGVTGVVDTGLARMLRYDDSSGLDRLELAPISQAAAQQRAGRAGRTAPGICLRLWPESAQRARPEREMPEIRRVDLAGAVLQLAGWIESDLATFPWFEAPRETSIEQSQRLLERLEAIDSNGITPLGRAMARLPLHPRLARMLLEGARLGQVERVALGAALLSERDPFVRTGGSRRAGHTSGSDLLDRIAALEAFATQRTLDSEMGTLHRGAAEGILRTATQLQRQISDTASSPAASRPAADEAVSRAVFTGFPDRLARRRELNSRRGVMVGGRGVRLADSSAVDQAELFVCLEVDAAQGEAFVRQASEVKRSWLPEELLTTKIALLFDEEKQQLAARRRVLWDDLVLEESPAPLPQDESAAAALAEAAEQRWDRVFPPESEAAVAFLNRVRFLGAAMPELGLPAFDRESLVALLPQLCNRRRSLAEVRRAPWLDYLRSALSYQQLQTLDREAPERYRVPSGSQIEIHYEPGKSPVLAVRIQELFGLADTPRLAGGRVPVLLHLLAPNMRVQQITEDLKSFWDSTYQQVRKELRRRYPKHAWPEDPWNALPQRRPGRPAS